MANVVGRNNSGPAGSHHGSIVVVVADKIKDTAFSEEVVELLVQDLVDRERKKRLVDISTAYDNIIKLQSELQRMKPDDVKYNDSGEAVHNLWSKGQLDAKKKLEERIAKYDRAFGAALGGDFKDLRDLNNNFKDKGGGGKETSSGSGDTAGT